MGRYSSSYSAQMTTDKHTLEKGGDSQWQRSVVERCQKSPGWGWPPWRETHVRGLACISPRSVSLFVCPSGNDRSRGRAEDRRPGRPLITQDIPPNQRRLYWKSTWQTVRLTTRKWRLLRITVNLIKYPESIERSVPPAMSNDYWWPQCLESDVLLVHRAASPQSPWPRFSANTHWSTQQPVNPMERTYMRFNKHNSHQQLALLGEQEQRVFLMQVQGERAEVVNRMKTSRVGWRQGQKRKSLLWSVQRVRLA